LTQLHRSPNIDASAQFTTDAAAGTLPTLSMIWHDAPGKTWDTCGQRLKVDGERARPPGSTSILRRRGHNTTVHGAAAMVDPGTYTPRRQSTVVWCGRRLTVLAGDAHSIPSTGDRAG
jgi:hypothetical protein